MSNELFLNIVLALSLFISVLFFVRVRSHSFSWHILKALLLLNTISISFIFFTKYIN